MHPTAFFVLFLQIRAEKVKLEGSLALSLG